MEMIKSRQIILLSSELEMFSEKIEVFPISNLGDRVPHRILKIEVVYMVLLLNILIHAWRIGKKVLL